MLFSSPHRHSRVPVFWRIEYPAAGKLHGTVPNSMDHQIFRQGKSSPERHLHLATQGTTGSTRWDGNSGDE